MLSSILFSTLGKILWLSALFVPLLILWTCIRLPRSLQYSREHIPYLSNLSLYVIYSNPGNILVKFICSISKASTAFYSVATSIVHHIPNVAKCLHSSCYIWPANLYTQCPDRWRQACAATFYHPICLCSTYRELWTCTPRSLCTSMLQGCLPFTVYFPLVFDLPKCISSYLFGFNSICHFSAQLSN